MLTPGGMRPIDTKRYALPGSEKRVKGGVLRPRVELLEMKGRDKTAVIDVEPVTQTITPKFPLA